MELFENADVKWLCDLRRSSFCRLIISVNVFHCFGGLIIHRTHVTTIPPHYLSMKSSLGGFFVKLLLLTRFSSDYVLPSKNNNAGRRQLPKVTVKPVLNGHPWGMVN